MDLSYPIGTFDFAQSIAAEEVPRLIDEVGAAPSQLRAAVEGLTDSQLDTPYRPEGWTVRQVVHHVADSHINSYIRFRLALTETAPPARGYDQAKWAELPDARTAPVEPSLQLLENLHRRWAVLLRAMTQEDYARVFIHSEMGPMRLDKNLALYAWHGRYHTAHITGLRQRMGWKYSV